MITTFYIVIGLAIFLYYLLKSGQNRSLEITMELGLAITLLAAAIDYSLSPVLQVAAIMMTVLLLLQKGFT
jgi:hypothetical protein